MSLSQNDNRKRKASLFSIPEPKKLKISMEVLKRWDVVKLLEVLHKEIAFDNDDLEQIKGLKGRHLINAIESYRTNINSNGTLETAKQNMIRSLMEGDRVTTKDVAESIANWLVEQFIGGNDDPVIEITDNEVVEFICSHINGALVLTNEGIQQSSSVIVNSFGTDFEFIGRNETMEAIERVYANQKTMMNQQVIDKSNVVLPFLATAPGVGKSRLLKEMGLKLFRSKDAYNCFPLFVTFGNGCLYDPEEEFIKSIESLFLRMIYSVVCCFSKEHVFNNFRDSFSRFLRKRSVKTGTVLSALKKIIGDENISFFIALDEVHLLASCRNEKELNPLGQIMSCIGQHIQYLPAHRMNIFPLFAGTYHSIISDSLSRSTYTPKYVPLTALLPEDKIYLILDNLLLSYDKLRNWRTNIELRHFLRLFGGFARGIEFYLKEYLNTEYNLSEKSALERSVSTLTDKYHVFNSLYSKALLYYIITRKVIAKTNVFATDSGSGKPISFSNLEHRGYIMLDSTKENQDHFIATYPPVLLRNLVPTEFISVYEELFFNHNKSVHGKPWEIIVHRYLYITLTLLSENEKDLTIGQLFPFAKMQPLTASILLEKIPIVRMVFATKQIHNQQGKVSLRTESDFENFDFDLESNNNVDSKQKKCCVTMNVLSAKAGDILIMGLQIKDSSSILIFHIQCKWADSDNDTLSLMEIQEELNSNRKLQFKNEKDEILETHNFTVIITGKSISNIPNDNDLIVIHKDNFTDYFGVFANQMKFLHAKRFLHINECNDAELQIFEGIDKKQAQSIITERGVIGFVDNDDLKNKVGVTFFNLLSKFEIIY